MAIILSAGASVAVVAVTIGATVSGRGISAAEGALLGTIIGAAIGAVATYLGGYPRAPGPPSPPGPPYDGEVEGDWNAPTLQ